MEGFSLIKCPQFLDNAITPPAKEIGNTLGNIFYAIFSPINYNVGKLKIKQAENLKKYEIDIQNELNKIPEEKLVEPKMSIVGPALEASRFYIEEDEIRKMFAKLIASSMNVETSSKVHNSFIEIVKQLSPIDASNLKLFSTKSNLPIVQYQLNDKNGGGVAVTETNVFISNSNVNDLKTQETSISNLTRLGLISVAYDIYLTDFDYSSFEKTILYQHWEFTLAQWKQEPECKYNGLHIKKGMATITPIGKDFISICL